MKKLMFAAAAVAMTSGAFAAPLVYDYKASVKHLYLKEVKVTIDKKSLTVYQKYQKSTSLKGYLIMDQDGVTSPTINREIGKEKGTWEDFSFEGNGFDYGRNRGFLVVLNSSAYKEVRHAKILPAVLDAKWIDTAFTKAHTATSGLAEGTLYVGGDAVAPVRQQLDVIDDVIVGRNDGAETPVGVVPAVPKKGDDPAPGMVAAADYLWTSIYLFAGTTAKDAFFNGPNWFNDGGCPFAQFEYAWDKNLPALLRVGWKNVGDDDNPVYTKDVVNYFHDTWMNGAGFGKWTTKVNLGDQCCGIIIDTEQEDRKLESLSGNLKGGLFLCTENGIDATTKLYSWFDGIAWEDQFNTARLEDGSGIFSDDNWQNDLWQDGFIEQETTDVISGTWSIKLNLKFFAEKGGIARDLDKTFVAKYFPGEETGNRAIYEADIDTTDGYTLWSAINGAALKLDPSVKLYDGTEIYDYKAKDRAKVPMLTPQFVDYYRLAVKNTKVN